MPIKTVLEAIREGLSEEMRRDSRVIVMGEDVGHAGGVFGATVGLEAEFGADRVIDTPLAESSIVGVAIGAAFNNVRPVTEIQFMDFIHPAMNQIMNEAARIRYRSAGDFSCPIVVRVPFGGGVHGGLYHSQSIEALFCHIPGLKCVAPSNPHDAKGLLKAAIRDDDPVIVCEHKRTYRLIKGEVPDGDYTVPIGRAVVCREGTQITVLTYGLMVHHALEAAEDAADRDIDVEVIDLRSLRPLDEEAMLKSVRKTGKVLIVHEANKTGGIGGEVAALIAEKAFDALDGPVTRLCGPDVPAMGYAPALEHAFMPDPNRIGQALLDLAAY
jgi:2-oxoisovalerate dehydrogenase E1 component beta subunit